MGDAGGVEGLLVTNKLRRDLCNLLVGVVLEGKSGGNGGVGGGGVGGMVGARKVHILPFP